MSERTGGNGRRGDEMDEPKGPEYERLARLARLSRPGAPPDFADRVMQAVAALRKDSEAPTRSRPLPAGSGFVENLRRAFRLPPRRIAGPLGILALAALALIIVAIVAKPPASRAPSGVPQPEFVMHRFELVAPQARKVCLVGDFNQWEICEAPMVKDNRTGAWSLQLAVPAGRHEYMFVVDGQNGQAWVTDPQAPVRVDDGFGNLNAVVFL